VPNDLTVRLLSLLPDLEVMVARERDRQRLISTPIGTPRHTVKKTYVVDTPILANTSFTSVGNEAECATKRIDEMGGKPQCLYRQALSPWGVAPGGCNPDVKELPLKGTGEAVRHEAR